MTLFERQGYFATTIEEITKEAGVSKGLVYNYFVSKEALLAALIIDTTTRMEAVAQVLKSDISAEESLTVFIESFFMFLKSEKQFLKLQLTLLLMPELNHIIGIPQRNRAKILLKIVLNWFEQAGVQHPKYKARLFLAMVDGIALHYLSIYSRYPLIPMKTHLLQATMGLLKDADPGTST